MGKWTTPVTLCLIIQSRSQVYHQWISYKLYRGMRIYATTSHSASYSQPSHCQSSLIRLNYLRWGRMRLGKSDWKTHWCVHKRQSVPSLLLSSLSTSLILYSSRLCRHLCDHLHWTYLARPATVGVDDDDNEQTISSTIIVMIWCRT